MLDQELPDLPLPIDARTASMPTGLRFTISGLMSIPFRFNGIQKANIQLVSAPSVATYITNVDRTKKNRQDFLDALECTNLTALGKEGYLSAIFDLTSESYRSDLVSSNLTELMNGYTALIKKESVALELAVTATRQITRFNRFNIDSGGSPAHPGSHANNLVKIDLLRAYVAAAIKDLYL